MAAEPHLRILDNYGNRIPLSAVIDQPYEGAATGRRMASWGSSTLGPTSSLYSSLSRLRSRTRELIRNNPLIQGATINSVANAISSGIFPSWDLEDKGLKAEIEALWKEFVLTADYYGTSSLYGLMALVWMGLLDAGEILSRKVMRSPSLGLPVPLQIQLLEADHLDEGYNTISPSGNEIRMGIEFDNDNRRKNYWLWTEHPGETFITQRALLNRVAIPASEIDHVFHPIRAGQQRGRPWYAAIIVKCHEYDQYDDAELVRKKGAAMFGGYIEEAETPMDPALFLGRPKTTDSASREVIPLEPGTYPVLPAGMKVHFSEPADVGQNYEIYNKQQLRQIATGMPGLTYEQLTGDLSGVNYSSIRAGLLESRRVLQFLQKEIVIFQFCRKTAAAFLDAAVISGAIKISDYYDNRAKYLKINWRPDGWPWVDPLRDVMSEKMAIRNGFTSRAQVVAGRGGDAETVDRENAEDKARAQSLGLVYDSDASQTANSGIMQTAEASMIEDAVKDQP